MAGRCAALLPVLVAVFAAGMVRLRMAVDPAPLFADHPTADEAVQRALAAGAELSGRTALVTGATSGIGLTTAEALARGGMRVVLTARDERRGAGALRRVEAAARAGGRGGSALMLPLDLGSLASVRRCVQLYREQVGDRLDVLINNAGYMPDGYSETEDGFPKALGVNHIGHFELTQGLLPMLRRTQWSRVVTVSSYGHKLFTQNLSLSEITTFETAGNCSGWLPGQLRAYGNSKAANILFAAELARREGPKVLSFSVHPGLIATEIGMTRFPEDASLWQRLQLFTLNGLSAVWWTIVVSTKTPEQGAATQVHVAVSPEVVGHTGAYFEDMQVAQKGPGAGDRALGRALWEWTARRVAPAL